MGSGGPAGTFAQVESARSDFVARGTLRETEASMMVKNRAPTSEHQNLWHAGFGTCVGYNAGDIWLLGA